jgi:spore coat polysaccharide biosynthesis protein SpsF
MTSTRLPGKVMKNVLGKPLLGYLIERLERSKRVDRVVVATTTNSEDDVIATMASQKGFLVFRGSEHNVLDRFYMAATASQADHILRITADCPLIDPDLVDELIEFYFRGGFDYATNCDPPTLPDGLDAEVFSFEALRTAHRAAVLPSELEHVTPYLRKHSEWFSIGRWKYAEDLSQLRWTVDEPEDFLLIGHILKALYPAKPDFRTEDILTLLENRPELSAVNNRFRRNEGELKSQVKDEAYKNHCKGLRQTESCKWRCNFTWMNS